MKLLITAGPTREPIDPVRFIGNRSSGKLGLLLAAHAATAGHDTTLLLGPIGAIPTPLLDAVRLLRYDTTQQLLDTLRDEFPDHDALVMAAAVADYTPVQYHDHKLPRNPDGTLTVTLQPTPDVVGTLATTKRDDQRIIAFALEEPAVLEQRAADKLQRKRVDAIVANPLCTMDADTIQPTWLTAQGDRLAADAMTKADFAPWLLARLASLA